MALASLFVNDSVVFNVESKRKTMLQLNREYTFYLTNQADITKFDFVLGTVQDGIVLAMCKYPAKHLKSTLSMPYNVIVPNEQQLSLCLGKHTLNEIARNLTVDGKWSQFIGDNQTHHLYIEYVPISSAKSSSPASVQSSSSVQPVRSSSPVHIQTVQPVQSSSPVQIQSVQPVQSSSPVQILSVEHVAPPSPLPIQSSSPTQLQSFPAVPVKPADDSLIDFMEGPMSIQSVASVASTPPSLVQPVHSTSPVDPSLSKSFFELPERATGLIGDLKSSASVSSDSDSSSSKKKRPMRRLLPIMVGNKTLKDSVVGLRVFVQEMAANNTIPGSDKPWLKIESLPVSSGTSKTRFVALCYSMRSGKYTPFRNFEKCVEWMNKRLGVDMYEEFKNNPDKWHFSQSDFKDESASSSTTVDVSELSSDDDDDDKMVIS